MATDHSAQIARLREMEMGYARIGSARLTPGERTTGLAIAVAADLLTMHDDRAISLDGWLFARNLVEHLLGEHITENGGPAWPST